MRFLPKEITIAIIIGFFIGIIITYGIWNTNRSIKQKQQVVSPVPGENISDSTPIASGSSDTSSITRSNSNLTLAQPELYTLSNTETIPVSGFSQPTYTIIIYLEKDYQIIYPDSQGQFNTQVSLEPGINHLSVVALDPQGQQYKLDRTVVYSTTELE